MLRNAPKKIKYAIIGLICVVIGSLYFLNGYIHTHSKYQRLDEPHKLVANLWTKGQHVVKHPTIDADGTPPTKVLDSVFLSLLKRIDGPPRTNYIDCSFNRHSIVNTSVKHNHSSLRPEVEIKDSFLIPWADRNQREMLCDAKVELLQQHFGILHDVVMKPKERHNIQMQAKGGEEVRHIPGQDITKEDFSFKEGFWEMRCAINSTTSSKRLVHMWFPYTKFLKVADPTKDLHQAYADIKRVKKFTYAVAREDYANLHNFVRGIYNAFMLMMVNKLQPQDVSVLIMDAHPYCELDATWETFFGPLTRVGHLEEPVLFENLIWGPKESDGPITDFSRTSLPYSEEFRAFFLNQHGLSEVTPLKCPSLTITVILRRNKVYHPRNMEGHVGRKFFNEAELIGGIMKVFPHACVQSLLMESLPMTSQLNTIRNTDILVGMHGAGMSHTLFLPKHAGILEIFPKDFKVGRHWYLCFEKIAQWRGLQYESWENFDPSIEMSHDYTIVPVDILLGKIAELEKRICKN